MPDTIKALLKTAKEPVEHRKIVAFNRQEARRLIAESKYHEDMAQTYRATPLPFEGKHPYGTVGLSHCLYWSRLDGEQAKHYQALAALHEDMPRAAEQK